MITGRERHVATAREWNLPYPHRAIRTRDFLYIRNFAPDRWSVGAPKGLDDPTAPAPDYEELCHNTVRVYGDLDAGPTKAWMIHHRAEPKHATNFALGFGKRPAEELYDLRSDPHHMHNLATSEAHAQTKACLSATLMCELRDQADPRVCEEDCRFEHSPYTDAEWDVSRDQERLARSCPRADSCP